MSRIVLHCGRKYCNIAIFQCISTSYCDDHSADTKCKPRKNESKDNNDFWSIFLRMIIIVVSNNKVDPLSINKVVHDVNVAMLCTCYGHISTVDQL